MISTEQTKYKTELCNSFAAGSCSYARNCQFAHGQGELRQRELHLKYKTKKCKNFWSMGCCRYGRRCRFIHDEDGGSNLLNEEDVESSPQTSSLADRVAQAYCDKLSDDSSSASSSSLNTSSVISSVSGSRHEMGCQFTESPPPAPLKRNYFRGRVVELRVALQAAFDEAAILMGMGRIEAARKVHFSCTICKDTMQMIARKPTFVCAQVLADLASPTQYPECVTKALYWVGYFQSTTVSIFVLFGAYSVYLLSTLLSNSLCFSDWTLSN
jgi:hypothetical protein